MDELLIEMVKFLQKEDTVRLRKLSCMMQTLIPGQHGETLYLRYSCLITEKEDIVRLCGVLVQGIDRPSVYILDNHSEEKRFRRDAVRNACGGGERSSPDWDSNLAAHRLQRRF